MFLSDTPTASEWSALDTSDSSSRTWSVLLTNGLLVGAVAVVVSMRIFTKVFMTASLFVDDCKSDGIISNLLVRLCEMLEEIKMQEATPQEKEEEKK